MSPTIQHRLLDILSVLVLTGVTYFALKVIATKFDTEGWVVAAVFITAVANKLGFRSIHQIISKRLP